MRHSRDESSRDESRYLPTVVHVVFVLVVPAASVIPRDRGRRRRRLRRGNNIVVVVVIETTTANIVSSTMVNVLECSPYALTSSPPTPMMRFVIVDDVIGL